MADFFTNSVAGSGTAPYDTWTKGALLLATSSAAMAISNDNYIAQDHAETSAAAQSIIFPGTVAAPNRCICANRAGTVPPVSADLAVTARIITTGTNGIGVGGSVYMYGVKFESGSGAGLSTLALNSSSVASSQRYISCKFSVIGTNAGSFISSGNTTTLASKMEWVNCTVRFGNASQSISLVQGDFVWKDTATAIDTAIATPTTLFSGGNIRTVNALIEGVDLSALGAGKTIVGALTGNQKYVFKDCLLGAGVTLAATPGTPAGTVEFLRCSDTAGNAVKALIGYYGTQSDEATIIRTGGAVKARKLVSSANAKRTFPFESQPLVINNTTVGSPITVTVYGIWGGGSPPTNVDCWMSDEYLGASGNPQGSFISSGPADPLEAASAGSADASVWGGSTTAFKMSKTFTPNQAGPITIYVKVGTASTTVYIDPTPVLS